MLDVSSKHLRRKGQRINLSCVNLATVCVGEVSNVATVVCCAKLMARIVGVAEARIRQPPTFHKVCLHIVAIEVVHGLFEAPLAAVLVNLGLGHSSEPVIRPGSVRLV